MCYHQYNIHFQKYLFKIFNLKSSIRNINCWWFSSPESMSPFRNGKKQKLPMVSRQNKKMCQTINYVFEYKEDVDLQNAELDDQDTVMLLKFLIGSINSLPIE